MKFGATLKRSIREEWKENYIDYGKLKTLLREKETQPTEWTERDESNFVEELVNVQIEKVNSFHARIGGELKERVSACEAKLEPIAADTGAQNPADEEIPSQSTNDRLAELRDELDSISKDIASLYKFARLNFTACLKAAKKHDRLKQYKIRPLVQVRLSSLPFSSEDYSPLLYKISALYAYIRQFDKGQNSSATSQIPGNLSKHFESHKFWVHPDNLLEVKTYILRRLPVLIYNPQSSKIAKANRKDPKLTSLYFDNPQFDLYSHKLDRYESAASLRLRWYGSLTDKPEIALERKIVPSIEEAEQTGAEERITLKEKEIHRFITEQNSEILERKISKVKERKTREEAEKYEKTARDMHHFIRDQSLQPVLRAVYTRTAFQIPGDDDIRISLDTDLVFIKEDSFNHRHPRSQNDWHREDLDSLNLEYPFASLPKDEICKFPYALLEIKLLNTLNSRSREWIADLMNSHLVYDAPRFSKFVHGVSVLFEDNVNSFPFWFGDLDKDIRKDPKDAWEREQDKLKIQAEEEFAVGSLVLSRSPLRGSSFKPSLAQENSSFKQPPKLRRLSSTATRVPDVNVKRASDEEAISEGDETSDGRSGGSGLAQSTKVSRFGPWGHTKTRRPSVKLPPGVTKPSTYIKDSGPLQIEAKVWLANQRTFIKWQHICVLLATLSLALYNAAGEKNNVARGIGFFFTGIAVFAGSWGYWMYIKRSKFITDRSERGFDSSFSLLGPIVICISMIIALIVNFFFKFKLTFTDTTFMIEDLTDPTWKTDGNSQSLHVQNSNNYPGSTFF